MLYSNENYATILQLEKKFNLTKLEHLRKNSENFVPNLLWVICTASFLENKISKEKYYNTLTESLGDVQATENNQHLLQNNTDLLAKNLPELKTFFKSHLQQTPVK